MTATIELVDQAEGSPPAAPVKPADEAAAHSHPSRECAAANSPRDHFPRAAVLLVAPFQPLVGPLTPRPNLTLADAVAGVL